MAEKRNIPRYSYCAGGSPKPIEAQVFLQGPQQAAQVPPAVREICEEIHPNLDPVDYVAIVRKSPVTGRTSIHVYFPLPLERYTVHPEVTGRMAADNPRYVLPEMDYSAVEMRMLEAMNLTPEERAFWIAAREKRKAILATVDRATDMAMADVTGRQDEVVGPTVASDSKPDSDQEPGVDQSQG